MGLFTSALNRGHCYPQVTVNIVVRQKEMMASTKSMQSANCVFCWFCERESGLVAGTSMKHSANKCHVYFLSLPCCAHFAINGQLVQALVSLTKHIIQSDDV